MSKYKTPGRKTPAPPPDPEEMRLKKERLALMERKVALQEGLPFLYGWKWYPWAREFFESTNRLNFLCAANQISKSSTQIRKAIDWATNEPKWPSLWKHKPNQFWYLYPTGKQVAVEFETKWKQFLPKGKFKTEKEIDGKPNPYAWREIVKNKEIFAIQFVNTGVGIYFKTYAQDTQALQTGTCDAIFCDEELPLEHYDELIFRLSASDGYFHMVFTATLGQEYWRQVIDPGPTEEEKLASAAKWTVSMMDCMFYEDGTPSHWTKEKIQMVVDRCQTHDEVLKRVYGKFILAAGGRKYPAYDSKRHLKAGHPLPAGWHIYAAVDYGSGGEKGHPSAIVFVAVRPDFTEGRVFRGWRGDKIPTTAGDLLERFVALRGPLLCTAQFYDWACKDFEVIATRAGEPFQPADKSHEKGEQIVNTLFKYNMLSVYDDPELQKLSSELSTVRKDVQKQKAKDDFCDALRYAVTRIPWNWSVIGAQAPELQVKAEDRPLTAAEHLALEIQERRKAFEDDHNRESARLEEEFAEINALCEF